MHMLMKHYKINLQLTGELFKITRKQSEQVFAVSKQTKHH